MEKERALDGGDRSRFLGPESGQWAPVMRDERDQAKCERLVDRAQRLVRERVGAGDAVVDATVGNGHDTVFLAGLVGSTGTVFGFDVQEAAIEAARERIPRELAGAVDLRCCGHERMAELVPGPVKAVMFNLGYLPGSDKSVITRAETTVAGLRQALELLAPGGIVTVVVYPGHVGAREEAAAVDRWVEGVERDSCRVVEGGRSGRGDGKPYLLAVGSNGP